MRLSLKRTVSALICAAVVFCGAFSCMAAGIGYVIDDIDKMNITLPDTMLAATRESLGTDEYFSVMGLDYAEVMNNFENGGIYLQGMSTDSALTVTVTMTRSSESEEIKNYTYLSEDTLSEVQQKLLDTDEYIACTPDEVQDSLVWLLFKMNVSTDAGSVTAYQAYTVYDGMEIHITLQRNGGDVTASDYATFGGIVSSVSFSAESGDYILPVIIAGSAVVLIVLIVFLVMVIKRAGRRHKRKKNERILSELASEYNLDGGQSSDDARFVDISGSSPKKGEHAESSEYIEEEAFAGGLERRMRSKYLDGSGDEPERKAAAEVSDEEIDDIISAAHSYEADADKVVYTEGQDVSKSRFENRVVKSSASDGSVKETGGAEEYDEPLDLTEDGLTEQDEFNNDEELVRAEARRTKFSDSDDFFEEAPKKSMGVLSRDELIRSEDFDVIKESENKAENVTAEPEVEEADMGVPIGERLARIAGGIKYFGIHCGYFFKNAARLIKRKRAAAKRRKAEERRREYARQRAERQRRQREAAESGSLVKVHSRTGSRASDVRRSTQRPQQRTGSGSTRQNRNGGRPRR